MKRSGIMLKQKYQNRVLVSFGNDCPMKCKHCYTYDLEQEKRLKTCDELVEDIKSKDFDIIYISQSYENFIEEDKGVELCQKLYRTYEKDIIIITRSWLSDMTLQRLNDLNDEMSKKGNKLFLAVSLCADNSYIITEDKEKCPSPILRLSNLERAHNHKISTLLLLRPIFPEKVIPIEECIGLIKRASTYIDAVISSGLIVTENIINKLELNMNNIKYLERGDSDYLSNIDRNKIKFLDVENELKSLEEYCKINAIPFFRHSMPALNYLR